MVANTITHKMNKVTTSVAFKSVITLDHFSTSKHHSVDSWIEYYMR